MAMRPHCCVLRALIVIAAVIAAVPASAAAQTAPSLDLEQLWAGDSTPGSPDTTQTTVEVQSECNPNGTSTITYEASGVAVGPYPGTFHETGTITGVSGNPFFAIPGQILTFEAEFTIDSPVGQVEGTKSGPLAGGPTTIFNCVDLLNPNGGGDLFSLQSSSVPESYEATITTPAGTSSDSGRGVTTVTFNQARNPAGEVYLTQKGFYEEFSSTRPVVPTTKEDCKHGGWQNYPHLGFKNQGDCVAFVATQGKNEPGQNIPGLP